VLFRSPDQVVGYAAFAFEAAEAPDPAVDDRGATLLQLARAAIGSALKLDLPRVAEPAWLAEPGATFVTLTRRGALQGCIGTLTAYRPLGEDVKDNAVAAAFHDPRFRPLTRAMFGDIRIEVSLLSPAELMAVADEHAAQAALRPHIDGVVFEYGRHRGLFLPQVWDELPRPAEFLSHLKEKAGLPMDFWRDGVRLSRFTVAKWKEDAT
jgi:AmmeMemoRadiSam system protein A